MNCRKCEYYIYDSSIGTSDCAKCDEVNEADVDCFENVIELETDEPTYKREQFQVIKGGKQ